MAIYLLVTKIIITHQRNKIIDKSGDGDDKAMARATTAATATMTTAMVMVTTAVTATMTAAMVMATTAVMRTTATTRRKQRRRRGERQPQ